MMFDVILWQAMGWGEGRKGHFPEFIFCKKENSKHKSFGTAFGPHLKNFVHYRKGFFLNDPQATQVNLSVYSPLIIVNQRDGINRVLIL